MQALIGAKDRRTLTNGIVACAVILVVGRGAPRWREWRENARNRAMLAAATVDRMEASTVSRANTTRRAQLLEVEVAAADAMILRVTSASEGVAELASMVRTITTEAGVAIDLLQLRADTAKHDGLARVGVRMTANGPLSAISSVLAGLETGAPLLVVRELSIGQGIVAGPDTGEERLRVNVLIEALALVDIPPELSRPTSARP